MKKAIVELTIGDNVFTEEVNRDMQTLYHVGSTIVRNGKRYKVRVRFRVYDTVTHNCLLAMYARLNPFNDNWTARLSRLCKYGGISGLDL